MFLNNTTNLMMHFACTALNRLEYLCVVGWFTTLDSWEGLHYNLQRKITRKSHHFCRGFWSLEVSIAKDRTIHFNPDQDIHLNKYPYQPTILFLSTAQSTAWS